MGLPPIRETFAAITGYKPIRLAPLASGPESRRRVDHHENDWSLKRDVFFHSVKQVVLMIGWGRLMMFNIKVAVSTTYKVANVLIWGLRQGLCLWGSKIYFKLFASLSFMYIYICNVNIYIYVSHYCSHGFQNLDTLSGQRRRDIELDHMICSSTSMCTGRQRTAIIASWTQFHCYLSC